MSIDFLFFIYYPHAKQYPASNPKPIHKINLIMTNSHSILLSVVGGVLFIILFLPFNYKKVADLCETQCDKIKK